MELETKSNKPVSERQMPYDLTYMWNLMKKINKRTKKKEEKKKERISLSNEGNIMFSDYNVIPE